MQIFLSYASEDKDVAEPIAFSLRARGHSVFLDRDDLPAGGEYDRRIEAAVGQSGLFVFLISPASVAKGRFTLTELEFARRKWRKADGHILPVMIGETPMDTVPSFLKAVTLLEPKGNVAAEVASAVDATASATVQASVLLFTVAGAISGALTTPLLNVLDDVSWLSGHNLGSVPLNIVLAGTAFALALAAILVLQLRFQPRQLLIIVAVLGGWYLALEVFIQRDASPPKGLGEAQELSELDLQCQAIEAGTLTATPELERSCIERKLATTETELARTKGYWSSLITHGLSGAIGALITVLGVPLATRRRFAVVGMVAATGAGIVVAVAFFVAVSAIAALLPLEFYTLFIPWQAAVAGVIGRYLR
ncbi:MAG: toll/interleukin-1 receptor domain-containing protein [Hyphomicrobiaceae bacterium]